MTPRDPYSEAAWRHSRRSNSGRRHDDGPIPHDYGERVKRDRHATAAIVGTLGALALMVAHCNGVGL